jgi:hypothetical protein
MSETEILNFEIIGPCDFVPSVVKSELDKVNVTFPTKGPSPSNPHVIAPATKQAFTHKWFEGYLNKLSYSTTSIEELRKKSIEISSIINDSTDNYYNSAVWQEGRLRKGMVVGSVQSGKTASMMGVTGSIVDHKTKIVVLLSGTKTALWHQTLLRVYKDLDNNEDNMIKRKTRKIIPPASIAKTAGSQIEAMYSGQEATIVSTLNDDNKVLILVIPKIYQHIYNVASVLENAIAKYTGDEPIHMVVFDDESDDASILDAKKSKTVPFAITRLWAGTRQSSSFDRTHTEQLYATYLAYTATPQANMLQIEANPLAPTDFIFALKTPFVKGSKLTFEEPNGLINCYTGGEVFYEQDYDGFSEQANIIQELEFISDEQVNLTQSMMCYVVGAAINMLDSGKKYSQLKEKYDSKEEAENAQLPVYSMVYHPAAETDDHFLGKQEIIYWLNNGSLDGFKYDEKLKANQTIIPTSIGKNIQDNEDDWEKWVKHLDNSIDFCNSTYSTSIPNITYSWDDIKQVILIEVIPNIKVKVINSKKDADDRPKFDVDEPLGSSNFLNIPDKLSIFVAGNVLSRGLTIENLAVTVFGRSSNEPAADTQMQMQRWFGYRGKILPSVRVFMTSNQYELFLQYHQGDNSLKERILNLKNKLYERLESLPYILEGIDSKATNKVDTSKIPLRPLSYPQFGIVESDAKIRENNHNLVEELLKILEFDPVKTNGKIRGYVSQEPVKHDLIVKTLESLQFSNHNPSRKSPEYSRWKDYANSYEVASFTSINEHDEHSPLVSVNRCPYSIAAYLEFWNHVSGKDTLNENDLFVFGSPSLWRDFKKDVPDFYITIRCGRESEIKITTANGDIDVKRVHRALNEDCTLADQLWGAGKGGKNQYSDQLFDYHTNGFLPVPKEPSGGFEGLPKKVRPVGHPGMFSIYFLEGSKGETQHGFAIGLPGGGPEHIRAIKG